MSGKVIDLGFCAHGGMQVNQVFDYCKKDGLKDALILGYDQEGALVVRSSTMTRKDALWLIEFAKGRILGAEL